MPDLRTNGSFEPSFSPDRSAIGYCLLFDTYIAQRHHWYKAGCHWIETEDLVDLQDIWRRLSARSIGVKLS